MEGQFGTRQPGRDLFGPDQKQPSFRSTKNKYEYSYEYWQEVAGERSGWNHNCRISNGVSNEQLPKHYRAQQQDAGCSRRSEGRKLCIDPSSVPQRPITPRDETDQTIYITVLLLEGS